MAGTVSEFEHILTVDEGQNGRLPCPPLAKRDNPTYGVIERR
jgi:hypothetical protein